MHPRLRTIPLLLASAILSPAVASAATSPTTPPARTASTPSSTARDSGPDPEIFDGTRTKKDEKKTEESKTTDKWEDANLILYDSDEEGSAEGGQGRSGGSRPGYADGAQGGVNVQVGVPLPLSGGGAGDAQQGGMPMPGIGAPGIETGQQGLPGMAGGDPASGQSTPTSGPSAQGGPPGGKPGNVAIGDPSQKIAQAAQPVNKVSGGVPPPPTGEEVQPSKGEDTTKIPNAASGPQSGQRGGGVEKGDAMPTDI